MVLRLCSAKLLFSNRYIPLEMWKLLTGSEQLNLIDSLIHGSPVSLYAVLPVKVFMAIASTNDLQTHDSSSTFASLHRQALIFQQQSANVVCRDDTEERQSFWHL